jgi:hypothetical protein
MFNHFRGNPSVETNQRTNESQSMRLTTYGGICIPAALKQLCKILAELAIWKCYLSSYFKPLNTY